MSPKRIYEFGPFRLDPAERLLLRAGKPVALTPKAFDTLVALVEDNGRLVRKDELMKRVWPDAFVEEVNLAQNVSAIRRALDANGEQYIETVSKVGYRLSVKVRVLSEFGAPAEEPQPSPGPPGAAAQSERALQAKAETPARIRKRRAIAIGLAAVALLGSAVVTWRFTVRPFSGRSHSVAGGAPFDESFWGCPAGLFR